MIGRGEEGVIEKGDGESDSGRALVLRGRSEKRKGRGRYRYGNTVMSECRCFVFLRICGYWAAFAFGFS